MRSTFLLLLILSGRVLLAQDLRVLTWNIRYDNPADSLDRWDQRKTALAQTVSEQRPHIIGLQECLAHQVDFLSAQWPGFARVGVGREDGIRKGEFSPVFFDSTVFELVESRTIWLSPTPDTPSKGWDAACERIATYIVLRVRSSGDFLFVVNTHWDHWGERSRMHSEALIQEALGPAMAREQRIIVMGDLNAEPGSEAITNMKQWLVDACPGDRSAEGTFNGFGKIEPPLRRIDYVWHSPRNWSVLDHDVLHPKVNGRHVSDHFPVVVDLRAQ